MWLDKNGSELHVGDWVRFGLAEGKVLILEDWSDLGEHVVRRHGRYGCYVSNIGQWGDCRTVEASRLVKVDA